MSRADAERIRLYLDCHIKAQLAEDLTDRDYDVLTTETAGRKTASDREQLAFAISEQRAIVTFNIRDFAPLHQEWAQKGQKHAGIIVSQQLGGRQYGVLLSRMLRLLEQRTADELQNALIHLEQFR